MKLSEKYPAAGYRMIAKKLRREGWPVNRKRVYRIWRKEGLQVPQKRTKKKRLGEGSNSITRRRPEHVGHVWGIDFIHDETEDGRRLRYLSVLDEYSRFDIELIPRRHFSSTKVIDVLRRLFVRHGAPKHIRCDNGGEFIADAIKAYLEEENVETLYIDPGSPWQNGYVERFHGTLRTELLNLELFTSLLEAEVLATEYRSEYNDERPHSSLDDRTPAEVFWEGMKEREREAADVALR
jgi:transposase InsO family protein